MPLIRELDSTLHPPSRSARLQQAFNLSHQLRSHRSRFTRLTRAQQAALAGAAVLIFLFLAIAVPLTLAASQTVIGAWKLSGAHDSFRSFNFPDSYSQAHSAEQSFSFASSQLGEFDFPLALLGHPAFLAHLHNFLASLTHLSSSLSSASLAADQLTNLSTTLLVTDQTVPITDSSTRTSLDKAHTYLQDSQQALQQSLQARSQASNFLTSGWLKNSSFTTSFSNLQLAQIQISWVINSWPSLTALASERNYLVFISDTHNLKPGGGVIVGVGVLSFRQGKLRQIIVADANELSSHSGKSLAFQGFLGNRGLNLTALSASPDFPRQASPLLHPSDSYTRSIDGALLLDDQLLASLLKITGPVRPSGYHQDITSENLSQLTSLPLPYSQSNPGILTAAAAELVPRIFHSPPSTYPQLTSSLNYSLQSKHLLVYLGDSAAGQFALDRNWSGSLLTSRVLGTSTNSVSDFLLVALSSRGNQSGSSQSLSPSASNSPLAGYSSRSQMPVLSPVTELTYSPQIQTNGSLQSHLRLTIKSTSPSPSHPDLFQIFTPLGSTLLNAQLNGVSISSTTSETSGLTTFTVPYQSSASLPINLDLAYTLPFAVSPSSPIHYSLQVRKQIGSLPISLHLVSPSPPAGNLSGISGIYILDQDLRFQLDLNSNSR